MISLESLQVTSLILFAFSARYCVRTGSLFCHCCSFVLFSTGVFLLDVGGRNESSAWIGEGVPCYKPIENLLSVCLG